MKNEPIKTNVSKLTKIISKSSQTFLASFLDDSIQEKKDQEKLKQKINLAISQQSFVVLQIKSPIEGNESLQTVAGKILKKQKNEESFILKTQRNNQLQMINIAQIRKISFMEKKEINNTIAE